MRNNKLNQYLIYFKILFIFQNMVYVSNHKLFQWIKQFQYVTYVIDIEIPNAPNITLHLDLSDSPKTVTQFVDLLPFSLVLNVWGDEIYTNESPINMPEENAKPFVHINDVAYWPAGKAICLFFGPTPISKKGKIIPASPVNVIGKILAPDKSILNIADGKKATFRLKS